MSTSTPPAISVVVPTRDRPDALLRCLEALQEQDADGLEVLVVDDGSRDREAVERAVAGFPEVQLMSGDGRGPAAARNVGVRSASGEVICFTDDDCEPLSDWARLLATRARGGGGAAAGLTVNSLRASAASEAAQVIVDYLQLRSLDDSTGALGFAPTSNLACRREIALELPFDESYPDAAAEDRDWCARAASRGVHPAYEEHAVVLHRHELSIRAFLRQQARYGRGAVRFRRGGSEDEPRRGLSGPSFYAELARAGFRRRLGVGVLVCIAQLATGVGAASERLSGLQQRFAR